MDRSVLRIAALAVSALFAADAAQAQEVRYPASLQRQDLVAWLQRETDITPGQVLAVSPSAVTGLVSSYPMVDGGQLHASIRGEALTPDGGPRPGVISWQTAVQLDCRTRRIQLGGTTGYVNRNLLGQPLAVSAGDSDWRPPPAGTQLENVWRALCEPGFVRPLGGSGEVRVSAPETAPQSAGPRPAPPAQPTPAPTRKPAEPPPEQPVLRPALPAGLPASPPAAGRVAVQVIGSSNEAEAIGQAVRMRDRFPLAGRLLSTKVQEAQVNGRTVYRGLVAGFASREEAGAWCGRLKAAGEACFIR